MGRDEDLSEAEPKPVAGAGRRSDADLSRSIESVLKWNLLVPETVTARVQKGWVTLEGEVGWGYQRDAAERAMHGLICVAGVTNSIVVNTSRTIAEIEGRLRAAR